jgi:hypothetical protein
VVDGSSLELCPMMCFGIAGHTISVSANAAFVKRTCTRIYINDFDFNVVLN